MTPNEKAFLDALAVSEIGEPLLKVSDNGYNVIVGSTATHPDLFTSYAQHPRKMVRLGEDLQSTAAGRYQLLSRYYSVYCIQLGIKDFSPASQDRIALQQISECHAIDDINAGRFEAAVIKCNHIWASLPGSPYGQHTNSMEALKNAYVNAGGSLS